jgi:hypothetical protein
VPTWSNARSLLYSGEAFNGALLRLVIAMERFACSLEGGSAESCRHDDGVVSEYSKTTLLMALLLQDSNGAMRETLLLPLNTTSTDISFQKCQGFRRMPLLVYLYHTYLALLGRMGNFRHHLHLTTQRRPWRQQKSQAGTTFMCQGSKKLTTPLKSERLKTVSNFPLSPHNHNEIQWQ